MRRREKTYTHLLTENDRIIVSWVKVKKSITSFSVQYDTFLNRQWVEISRIDTRHGYPHRHTFSPLGRHVVNEFPCKDLNQGFTEAKKFITEKFEKLRENYLTQASKRRL